MKRFIASIFAILSALTLVVNGNAQTGESFWLTMNTKPFKTGETVPVTLNAASATPVQGFTFQIRYDPSCLQPINASSPIPGMNGLPLPQLSGLVDGSYASITPQTVNGVIAEVRFTALKECQTELVLESAALAVRNAEGFAVPLPGVVIDGRNVTLLIGKEVVEANSPQSSESGSILPLDPPKAGRGIPGWVGWTVPAILAVGLSILFGASKLFRTRRASKKTATRPSAGVRKATLHIKHGPHAGKSFTLNKFPALIGRDTQNDICVNDPHVVGRHAQIFSERNGYYLRDLGGETLINGRRVKNNTVILRTGDVVRLGRSFLFVFGGRI